MRSNILVFIRRSSFVYLFVILAAAFGLESVEASSTEPHTGVVTAADGVLLHYSTYGAGSPALILVHGISCDRSYWKEQVAPFSRDFRVVTMDLAGHGESGLGRKEWTIEAYGSDVAAVVEALDLKSGHSMGGAVILKAARRLPGRVKGLVIVDTYEDFATWWTTEEMEGFLAPFRENFTEATDPWVRSMFLEKSDPVFVEQIVTDMSSAPPEVALPSLESAITVMVGRERTTALQGLDAPVFVINADYEPTDVESMERDGVEVHIIPGTGHFFMMEDSARFNSVLTNVVESIVD
jgi:pimeloyl-ACP methyl ester carboxylesterase